MTSQYGFAPHWWESTGYLNGKVPTVDPDDPYRISTMILPVYQPLSWQFQATGSLYPGAPYQWQGGVSSYTPIAYSTPVTHVPHKCMDECTMGGCDDPTSWVHEACVKQGCCSLPVQPDEPVISPSQQAYIETHCEPGTKEYCQSDLDYFNCMPFSTLTPATDPTCAAYKPDVVPY